MLKAVIFDFDGVLADTLPLHSAANAEFLQKMDKPYINSGSHREGMRVVDIMRDYKDVYNLPGSVADLYRLRQDIFFKLVQEKFTLVPETLPLLNALREKGLSLCLATCGSREYLDIVFKKYPDFGNMVKVLVTGDDVERGKPYPDIYKKTLSKLFLPPYECIAVEDSLNGILAAKAAGLAVLAVVNPHYPDMDYSDADMVFDNLSLLQKALLHG